MVVWRAEGPVGHTPAWREDNKVGDGDTRPRGPGGEHGEDGGVLGRRWRYQTASSHPFISRSIENTKRSNCVILPDLRYFTKAFSSGYFNL